MTGSLILVLGDQLSLDHGALKHSDPACDVVLMAEVAEEAGYVSHNRHKLVFLFSAMRHFRQRLEQAGYRVIYRQLDEGVPSLSRALDDAILSENSERIKACEPGEFRVKALISAWAERCRRDFT